MKIDINQIPPEGLILKEDINVAALDLETEVVKFLGPLSIKADILKISNAVEVALNLKGIICLSCGRCLGDFDINLDKDLKWYYPVEKSQKIIDLSDDIRQEIMLDYPVKPLCRADCQGLCLKCGHNLNESKCNC